MKISAQSSASVNEEDVNWDAFKSEEVKNSCQWISNQYEVSRQSSMSGSAKGSLRKRKPSPTESLVYKNEYAIKYI